MLEKLRAFIDKLAKFLNLFLIIAIIKLFFNKLTNAL